MKFFIVFLALIFTIAPAQALTRVYIEGNINYNGEYTKPEILLSDSGSTETRDAVPDLTLSDLIINVGGFRKNSDIKNIIFVRNDAAEYIDFTDKAKRKTVLKDGDKIIVGENNDLALPERDYIDFIRNKYYQNTVLLCIDRTKQNEIIPYKAQVIKDILVKLANYKNFKYKILVKRLDGDGLKKIKVKSFTDFKIMPDDIIYIGDAGWF
jgi:protein involved in polysaccharide export with SLBB domain